MPIRNGWQEQRDMNETPDLMWLAVTTLGVLALGGMLFYAMIRYRAGRNSRRSRPTDGPQPR
jgi:hypothetical protein